MAEEGRSLCVRGLPADLEPERLADKLHIHFLRSRNGGGEITALSIKSADRFAIVTFEESRVAHNVLSHCPHILEVDGRKYELSLSFPGQESALLNKVILDMSMTIDCSQLPLGEETVKKLCAKYRGLRVQFIRPQRRCTLYGLYSEVQAFVSQLVELLGDSDPLGAEQQGEARQADVPHGLRVGGLGSLYGEVKASELSLQNPGQKGKSMDLSQAQGDSGKEADWTDEADVEALSLIMEADVFAYLRSRSEQYKRILLSHGAHVVDATSDGVTTLYLQSDAKVRTGSEAEKHVKQACKELGQLYQKVESNLRRVQIQWSALGLRGGNTEAFKELQALLPKVLLSYDQTHVYIVGESNEVSEAKQILLLGSGSGQGLSPTPKKGSSLSPYQSNSYYPTSESGTIQMAEEQGETRAVAPKTSMSGADRRGKGGEEYKLAARFKNSEMGLPGFYPGERGRSRELQDLTTSMNMLALASSYEPRSTLATAGTVNGDKAGVAPVSALRVTGTNCTADDVLFQKKDPLSFVIPFKTSGPISTKVSGTNSTESTSKLTPAVKAPPSTSRTALSGLDTHTLAALGTTSTPRSPLKRANSFSGRPSPKLEAQKTEKTGISGANKIPNSNSFSSGKPPEEPTVSLVSREVTVSNVMWTYMKEAYRSRLDTLISDLQVTESLTDKDEVRVVLKGSELSKVEERQVKLQKLIGMIASDFCVQELRLADLGVTESNEVFKACCSKIRLRFSKISLRSAEDTVLLIGPKPLCTQATEMLKEEFLCDVSNSVPYFDSFTHQGALDQSRTSVSADQTRFQRQIRQNQTKADAGSLEGYSINQALRHTASQSETWSVSSIQSPKQKPSGKERNGTPGDLEIFKTGIFQSQSSERNEALLGQRDDWPKPPPPQKKQKTTTTTLKQTNLQVRNKSEPCVCGDTGAHVARTSCGVFLCPLCLPLHAECIVCSKEKAPKEPSQKMPGHQLQEEQNPEELTGKEASKQRKQAQGIQGTMRYVELPLSLQGHSRCTTAKIIYCIPDGIQGEEHPNPGAPFQGGIFEAYLPLSSKGRSLLPCLDKAFKQGLTFKVCPAKTSPGRKARIDWGRIPHKTRMDGGKSGNGYPDSTYLNNLSEALMACGIEGVTLSENKTKS
ncbi:uncharacterized protein si:busm1-163l24.3 [Colossoma macropomum]|uniref:uncharacterized protein si:busm1-163l24.3 n=1 Tax=Colossoma macropomum TaxID=42526 RepID=UPI001865261E|nr:uncharacterized protein si:busm1-163l24.3 [Colossoma macropomum]XP_036445107.1 uncharacterized protein si:busm1-163l24.3 [Colossoma macropomum]